MAEIARRIGVTTRRGSQATHLLGQLNAIMEGRAPVPEAQPEVAMEHVADPFEDDNSGP